MVSANRRVVIEQFDDFAHIGDSDMKRVGVEGFVENFAGLVGFADAHVEEAEGRFGFGVLRHGGHRSAVEFLGQTELQASLQIVPQHLQSVAGMRVALRQIDHGLRKPAGLSQLDLADIIEMSENLGQFGVGWNTVQHQVGRGDSGECLLVMRVGLEGDV